MMHTNVILALKNEQAPGRETAPLKIESWSHYVWLLLVLAFAPHDFFES